LLPGSIEEAYSQGNHGGRIGPFPAHAASFHTEMDHQGDPALDQATSNVIACLLPLLVIANPLTVIFHLGDGLLTA